MFSRRRSRRVRSSRTSALVISAAVALSGALAGAGCADDATHAPAPQPSTCRDLRTDVSAPAQMNDVTTVLPLAKSQTELASSIKASDRGARGALLPSDVYVAATGEPLTAGAVQGGILKLPYDQLRVVALRIDPCFANIGPITDATACDNQVRVVYQAISCDAPGGACQASDGAIHAFYRLSRTELVAMLHAVVALRASQQPTANADLGPLAAHPIVVSQGLAGPMNQGLACILETYAGGSNLVRLTRMVGGGDPIWHFDGFDLVNGVATPMRIPTLPNDATSVLFSSIAAVSGKGLVPATTSLDDVSLLASSSGSASATAAARQEAFDATLRIENPGKHSPNTIDCASCHLAEPVQYAATKAFGLSPSGNANAFVADPAVAAADVAHTTADPNAPQLNLHALSYRDVHLAINQRVINETASVVAYANQRLLTP